MKKAAVYARVSTASQTPDNQLLELRATAARMGFSVVAEFVDNGISGAKGRADRPALDQKLTAAAEQQFDLILCWDISRLGRSLQDLVQILNDLQSMKIDLLFRQQGLDTSTSSGRMMFSIFGALAEYERALIRERVIAGKQRAKSQGVKMGCRSKVTDALRLTVRSARARGEATRLIAAQCQVGIGTVYAALA